MKNAAKTAALVLAVSLLSGCSSSPEPADKPQAKTRCEIAVEKVTEKAGLLEACKDLEPMQK